MKLVPEKYYQIKRDSLFCFTPLVSLSTFGIETLLAIYVLYRFRSPAGRLSALFLFFLGIFQLMEYSTCAIAQSMLFVRIAFIVIAFLPIIWLHIMQQSGHKRLRFIKIGYFLTFLLIIPLLVSDSLVSTVRCTGYYVVFTAELWHIIVYGGWYWIILSFGIYHIVRDLKLHLIDRKLNIWTLVAFLAFIIPTLLINFLIPFTFEGHVSMLCGFAIFTALILVFKVLPRYHYLRKKRKR